MRLTITPKNFTPGRLDLLEKAQGIIEDFESMGYQLTLRQLYYQLVAADLLPNQQNEYKKLGSLISDARWAGLVDWEAIEDRTRNVSQRASWDSPTDIMEAVASQYHEPLHLEQDHYIEVWVEKDALIGVIEKSVRSYDVPCMACRGYISSSEAFSAVRRIRRVLDEAAIDEVTILHLGDHDPSGIDMTRDLEDRLNALAGHEEGTWYPSFNINVERIALNMDQIRSYQPPPNPAKLSDSRAGDYVKKYGRSSWELDALRPDVIDRMVKTHLEQRLDMDIIARGQRRIEERKKQLRTIANSFDQAVELVEQWQRGEGNE